MEEFAGAFRDRGLPLHCLIANAGVMVPEGTASTTEDGFEVTIGTSVSFNTCPLVSAASSSLCCPPSFGSST